MSISLDITVKRLKEARLNSGLTQEEVAAAIGIPRTAVVNIEAGRRSISTLELSQLAKIYQRPVSYFFEEKPAITSFDVPDYEHDKLVRKAINQCQLETHRFKSIVPTYNPVAPSRSKEAIEQGMLIAEEERHRLRLGSAPIADIINLIHTQGIWTWEFELPVEVTGIVNQSTIIVNSKHSSTQKRLSYAHGYAHVVIDCMISIVISTDKNSHELIERRASAFAATLFIPQDGIIQYLKCIDKGRPSRWQLYAHNEDDVERRAISESQQINFMDVVLLAQHFGTTYESVVYRLRDLRIIRSGERQRLLNNSQRTKFVELAEGTTLKVAYLAIEAFRREEISSGYLRDLGERLGIDGTKLIELGENNG